MARHAWDSVMLQQKPIQKINIYKKPGDAEAYMRGFEIIYQNGSSDTVNSTNGDLVNTIHFEDYDELVGMTVAVTSESDKRPRRFGFSLMRNSESRSESYNEPVNAAQQQQEPSSPAINMSMPSDVNYRVFETKLIGNEFRLESTWPSIQSLQGRNDVENMRLS